MSALLLCNEPTSVACPPKFRLRSPGWIDTDNFAHPKALDGPAAGIRLRWTLPFLTPKAADRTGRPTRYVVERAGPLNFDNLKELDPDVGHRPRAPTPPQLWNRLTKVGPLTFSLTASDCDSVEAVTFRVPTGAGKTVVSLVDVHGITLFMGEIKGGELFHFELSDLKTVVFSEDVGVTRVLGLDLFSKTFQLQYQQIAEIDADAWHSHDLADVSARIARGDGTPFGTITSADWAELIDLGTKIDSGFANSADVDELTIAKMRLSTELQFETAALIGCGFVDGERPPLAMLDKVQLAQMLKGPDDALYAYRVIATLETPGQPNVEMSTNMCFVRARLALPLSAPRSRATKTPTARLELVTPVATDPGGETPKRDGQTVEKVECTGSWEVVSRLPWDEIVVTTPIATDSVMTNDPFKGAPSFLSGHNRGPRMIVGTTLVEVRDLKFDIPFFDCEVGVEAQIQDYWDRRGIVTPARLVEPEIDYRGIALPIESGDAWFDEVVSGSKAKLTFDQKLDWKADRLASATQAQLKSLMRHPQLPIAEADAEIGPATPTLDGHWQADLFTQADSTVLANFVEGFLTVGAFVALVRSIGRPVRGRALITFEALSECGGAALYHCPGPKVAARVSESPRAPRLWIPLDGGIAVQSTGAPTKYALDVMLPTLEASQTLSFSSRLEFTFRGRDYQSPLSVPVVSPYLHPAPKAPQTCLDLTQLATDFYGRTMVRVSAGCPDLDGRYGVQLEAAPNRLTTPDTFLEKRQAGQFGPQQPFEGDIIFESFTLLSAIAENDPYTIGLSYVREADQRESPPKLDLAARQRVE